jgi:antitoxin component YwqK of YwqJK toxin-antitoxin module
MKSNRLYFILIILVFYCQKSAAQSDFNKLDENGLKHGIWKGFYEESKRQRYEGTFEHGKEIGIFYFYDDTKAKDIIATRTFNPKDNSAYTIFYNQKKFKVSEGKEVNKLYEGTWKYYHKDSEVIMTLENYKNGKLNGKRTVFYPNSKIAEESDYVNGLKQGKYKKYSEDGIVLEESNFKDGLYDGNAIYRDPLGNIAAEGKYVANKKTGIWKFYENGKLVSTENMSYPQKRTKKSTDLKK